MRYIQILFITLGMISGASASVPQAFALRLEQFLIDELQSTPYKKDAKLVLKPLDNKVILDHCSDPIRFFVPQGTQLFGARTTVGIQCTENPVKTLYLPVAVQLFKPVLTANRMLPAHTVLTCEDFSLQDAKITALNRGFFDSAEALIGKVVHQALYAGQVIAPQHVREPRIITKGQLVQIISQLGPVTIRSRGKALQEGIYGQRIQVENLSSNRIIEAFVQGPGSVYVNL